MSEWNFFKLTCWSFSHLFSSWGFVLNGLNLRSIAYLLHNFEFLDSISAAAVTDYHKFSNLKGCPFIIPQFCSSEVWSGSVGLSASGLTGPKPRCWPGSHLKRPGGIHFLLVVGLRSRLLALHQGPLSAHRGCPHTWGHSEARLHPHPSILSGFWNLPFGDTCD